MLHLRLVLRDVVERFLHRVGFAAFLGPAPGVVVISLACQTHLRYKGSGSLPLLEDHVNFWFSLEATM